MFANPLEKAKGMFNKYNPFKNMFETDETKLNAAEMKKIEQATKEMQKCLTNYKNTVQKTSGEMIENTKNSILDGIENMQNTLDKTTNDIKEGVINKKDELVDDFKTSTENLKEKTAEISEIVEKSTAKALGTSIDAVDKASDKVGDVIGKIPSPNFESSAKTLGLLDDTEKKSNPDPMQPQMGGKTRKRKIKRKKLSKKSKRNRKNKTNKKNRKTTRKNKNIKKQKLSKRKTKKAKI